MLQSNKSTNSNSKGLTLIELLVVITLIGILSGLLVTIINPVGLRAKARDSQRKSDLKQIQTALELFFADNRTYPASSAVCPSGVCSWIRLTGADVLSTSLTGGGYLNTVPRDPINNGTQADPCTVVTDYRYNYVSRTGGSMYVLTSIMESPSSDEDSKCINLDNWQNNGLNCVSQGTWDNSATDVCYGVENP